MDTISGIQNRLSALFEKARMRKKEISLVVFLSLVITGITELYIPHTRFEEKTRVFIPQGAGSRKIAELLKETGAIRSKWAFVVYVSLRGSASALKPGEYTIFPDMSIRDIAADLVRGGGTEIVFTVPEGWRALDIGRRLEELGVMAAQEFLRAAGYPNIDYRIHTGLPLPKDYSSTYTFLADKPWYVGLDGYLFPDTYRIFRDATAEEIIEKMLGNFGEKLTADFRTEIARQKKSVFEIVIIASLVEKEVRSDEDRAIVAGILWKRLSRGMPLQVDATINYITGGKNPSATREETKIPSPYNTYLSVGLPLGPIANPGLSAIRAAIYPKHSPYLFYLSTPEGKTLFFRTFDEHIAAKRKYLQ